ncbi:hypothetical protein [Spirosoma fluviale]|uniref:Uncharacterized protein n=1 Tax=Spirosoma fluviale TaxID=1597977 RepID=A0A286G9H3_9BACT|nr:hypothetical protein [Spirosoma fluviale]SOD92180.1 hypothetical protein SAMN06269250_3843 [Spirosoma fluviale]
MALIQVLSTTRVGQLTGSTDLGAQHPKWPLLVDAQHFPLLNDTGHWGAQGADLGANTEHSDGRLYIFFGDTTKTQNSPNKQNTDLVAWTDETNVLEHGGHLALGLNFTLPFEPTSVPGQPDWRFCGKCSTLFWDGDAHFKGVCSKGRGHTAIGLRFVLPFEPTSVSGQPEWRFCGKCAGLFWNGEANKGACPTGGMHEAIGFRFVIPFGTTAIAGQPNWRFCGNCRGLFWDGDANKGLCTGAPGGGFHLHGVLNNTGIFDPFSADPPIGQTLSLEVPNGAFSYAGKVYVFAGIGDPKYTNEPPRFGDPAVGAYLVSKARPDLPGPYRKEFLYSPRIGWCPTDERRNVLESHQPLGFKFIVSHSIPVSSTQQGDWRFCAKCATMFWDGDATDKGICSRGGSHKAVGFSYVLTHSVGEDSQNQANWHRCRKCAALFWNGNPQQRGLCPGGDTHEPTGVNLVMPHSSLNEDPHRQLNWRFCRKCGGLFWDGDGSFKGTCSTDGRGHEAIGFNFALAHDVNEDGQNQQHWRFCKKCAGLFWNGDQTNKGICPSGNSHEAIGFNFVLPHDVGDNAQNQHNWRFCGKCSGLFWDGDSGFKGTCSKDSRGHEAIGFNFVLPHNPGEDVHNQGGWRFCTKCSGLVWTQQPDLFSWVAPCVIQTAAHPGLPESPHPLGLVMFGFGFSATPGIRLAWMPLKTPSSPQLQDILYFTGNETEPWSNEADGAALLLSRANTYTHLSAAWLEGPQRWILLYSNAVDDLSAPNKFQLPTVARFGTTLFDWSEEIEIFNPLREQAYGKYMHKIGRDRIHPDVPPQQDPTKPEHDGWSYGAFLLNRFTEWNEHTRELTIYYLLSLSSPYQVQLMHSRLLIPD